MRYLSSTPFSVGQATGSQRAYDAGYDRTFRKPKRRPRQAKSLKVPNAGTAVRHVFEWHARDLTSKDPS